MDLCQDLGYNPCTIQMVSVLVFLETLAMNFDHGALPAALAVIMKDYSLNKIQMGILGSLVFAGLVAGSMTALLVLEKFQYKHTLLFALIVNGLGLMLMTITKEYYLICIARFISGFA